jgi:predicted nucleic acid-binding protein
LPRIVACKGEKLYIDANVLVHFLYTKQRQDFSKKAKNLLQKIENRHFQGVISSLALMELIKSLRELLIAYGNVRKTDDVEKIIREQISNLFKIKNIVFFEGRPPDLEPMPEALGLYYCEVCNEALTLLYKCTGKASLDNETGKIIHKGLHTADVFHVVLARKSHCNKIATFEWNFKEAEKEITPLILQDYDSIW